MISRTRRQSVPDWHSQFGDFAFREWRDPVWNDGSHPVLIRDDLKKYPDWDQSNSSFKGQQITVDENHGLHDRRDLFGHGIGDVGGNFWSQKKWAQVDDSVAPRSVLIDQKGYSSGTWYHCQYNGPIFAKTISDADFPSYVERNLGPLGTTAIARCKPTNNVANLATDIAETFQMGLPHLWGSTLWKDRTLSAKAAGSEYLNHEFGWMPLVGDIRNSCYAVANAHRLMDAYERNSGKQVRRRYEFPIEKTETNVTLNQADGSLYTGSNPAGIMYDGSKPMPYLNKRTTFYRRTWFSGAFTYHLPIGYKSRNWLVNAAAKAGPLVGIELTPNVVWNAMPWTWAIDWFSNMGDVVNNLSDWSTDGLVLRYGYIMEHTLQRVTYSLAGPTRYKPYGLQFASPITYSLETKRRQKATPFGFEVTWNMLTSRQLAIAAALGLTRVF